MELFWSNGYEATGMTDLLDHMGIQRQSFYNTFESKKRVYLEAVEVYARQMLHSIREILTAPGDPLENFQRVFAFWEGLSKEHVCCGCLLGNAIAEFGINDEAVSAMLKTHLEGMEDVFHDGFKRAVDEGRLPGDRNPRALARMLVTVGQGLALLSKTGMEPEKLREVMKTTQQVLLT
ncbi:MAG: TetR/AcrR family transcriptional regulator [Verrucomicrobiota bacterium]